MFIWYCEDGHTSTLYVKEVSFPKLEYFLQGRNICYLILSKNSLHNITSEPIDKDLEEDMICNCYISDAHLVLKKFLKYTDNDIRQICVRILNKKLNMYGENTTIEFDNLQQLVSIVNKKIYNSSLISSRMKSVTSAYLNIKIPTALGISFVEHQQPHLESVD